MHSTVFNLFLYLFLSTVIAAKATSITGSSRKLLTRRRLSSHKTYQMGGHWMDHATWTLTALTCDSNPVNSDIATGKANCGFFFADTYNIGNTACIIAPLTSACNYAFAGSCAYHNYQASCEAKYNNKKYVGFNLELGKSVKIGKFKHMYRV